MNEDRPPTCPYCRRPMKLLRSMSEAASPLFFFFHCSACNHTATKRRPASPRIISSGQLGTSLDVSCIVLDAPARRAFLLRIVGVPAPEGYMMPDFTIALAIGLVIGFILGYGVRAIISYRRHRHARRQSYRF
jgi:hypothetical protein